MKICIIATRHSLDDARVVHKEALSLSNAGHDVCLILPCNSRFEFTRYDGSIIDVGKPPDGQCTHRGLKIYGFIKKKGLIGKYKTFLTLSNFAANLNADVYHAHEPDLSLAIAIRAKQILKKRKIRSFVVHDMHEYPLGSSLDVDNLIIKTAYFILQIIWNKISLELVDQVFTANNIVRGYMLFLNHKMNVDVLYNAPILKLFPQPKKKPFPKNGEKILFCHEGSLPFNRGLKEMITAISHHRENISLKIIGDVYGSEREWLMNEIKEKNLQDTIYVTGWLPYEKVGEAINNCHVGLILFKDTVNNRMAGPPNKLFNYMNSGLPVLSVNFPEMRKIILEEECGVLIYDSNSRSIIKGIDTIFANYQDLKKMSKNGLKAIRERYSWEIMEKQLLLSYKNLSKN